MKNEWEHMPSRLEITVKDTVRDTIGEENKRIVKNELNLDLGISRFIDVYNIDADLSEQEIELLANDIFVDSIIQNCEYKKPALERNAKILATRSRQIYPSGCFKL